MNSYLINSKEAIGKGWDMGKLKGKADSEFPGLEALINAGQDTPQANVDNGGGFYTMSKRSKTDKRVTLQHGYRHMKAQFLEPGDWVFTTPRDRQVVSVQVQLKPKPATVVVVWGDLGVTTYPLNQLILASPWVKAPALQMATPTRQDRVDNYVTQTVIPTIEGARLYMDDMRKYGNAPPEGIAQKVNGLITHPNPIPAVADWEAIIKLMHSHRSWGYLLKRVESRLALFNVGENKAQEAKLMIRDTQGFDPGTILNWLDIMTEPMLEAPKKKKRSMGVTINIDTTGLRKAQKQLGDSMAATAAAIAAIQGIKGGK